MLDALTYFQPVAGRTFQVESKFEVTYSRFLCLEAKRKEIRNWKLDFVHGRKSPPLRPQIFGQMLTRVLARFLTRFLARILAREGKIEFCRFYRKELQF